MSWDFMEARFSQTLLPYQNSMHERNAHNFPLDLAAGEVVPVAMKAPAIHA